MEITCKNYYKLEKELINLIETSDYISFDLEMTGIESENNNSLLDTPEFRYSKYKQSTEKYSIIQLGLSFFKLITNPNLYHKQIIYECRPYNLYLFPNSKDLKDISQDEMQLEVKCMHFIKKGKIDLNKWVNEGIQYLNKKQYRDLYKNIIENNINNDDFHMDITCLKQKDLDWAEKIMENIKNNFINNGNIYKSKYVISCLPKYLLYYIRKNLPNNLYFQENSKFNNKSFCTLIIGYKTQDEKDNLFKNDVLNQLKELNHKKGVKKLIEYLFNNIPLDDIDIKEEDINKNKNKNLINIKKKLIGHNMSLDIMYIISKLGEGLPNNYISFKKMIKEKLDIYDTKFLFEEFKNSNFNKNNNNIKDVKSVLNNIYPYLHSTFEENIKIKIKPNEDLFKGGNYHNAGYDSFVTGACFLYMKNAMKNFDADFLEKNKNQIFIMNSLYKSININKEEDEYIMNNCNNEEEIYIFRGIRNINEVNFEEIFGKKIWDDSVIKIFNIDKNNILVVFTKFDKLINNENKTIFENIAFSKKNKNKFTCVTLKEYRNKYIYYK